MKIIYKQILAIIALALLALAGNMLNVSLLFGLHFIFGSVAAMLAVKLLGLWPAVVVATVGGAYTWGLWGHPYAMVIFALEAVTVSVLYRRGLRNLVLADLVYWLVAGLWLVSLFYGGVLGLDAASTAIVALKQLLNGLFNALIAGILIKVIIWLYQDGSVNWLPKDIRLDELLFHVLLFLTLIAGATPVVMDSYTYKGQLEKTLAEELEGVLGETDERIKNQPNTRYILEGELVRHSTSAGVSGLTLINRSGEIIANVGVAESPKVDGKSLTSAPNLSVWIPDTGGSLMSRWKNGHYLYREPLSNLAGAELIVYKPAEPLIQKVELQRDKSFSFLAVMTLISVLISFVLSRVLTKPLQRLENISKQLPEHIRQNTLPELPTSKVHEYSNLTNSLKGMSDVLTETFSELDRMRANLEQEVVSRTRELKNTSTMLKNVVGASTEMAIVATDTEGVITLFNSGAENLLGYGSHKLVGKETPALFHLPSEINTRAGELSQQLGEKIEGFRVFTELALRDGSDAREWTFVTKHGEQIPVMLRVTPIHNESGELSGFLGIAEDVSERKRIENFKNEFISTVSHELRTPITSISGSIRLIASGHLGDVPEKMGRLLETAERNSKRLSLLINDLLDIEKIAAGKLDFDMKSMPLLPVIEQTIEENQSYGAERKVTLVLVCGESDINIVADELRLKQVMANLLSNAIKFSPVESEVIVDVASTEGKVTVSVLDKGPGVPAEFHDRIFHKFAQADSSDTRQVGGTGLGLAITKELITQMRGNINFETSQGEGTRFYFSLPVE
ncbi:ATP-binding protein [Gilvimarinus sp. SDUM040013]|uniref:histidine kinase n=1 Tax=Gilvimarinus gilvus TaxID=3058038 RepID=A0ABU4S2I7_9GAMM|nr:ATP-binding protein [Gilvimarinus sp. SDUM040013]MDO3387501.1 ATP-binding protein [Gilvimarinus sp. SDUM040013]MDX6851353.1 ATP-binding protein [Gilvimarinus sp. SDUM040013]